MEAMCSFLTLWLPSWKIDMTLQLCYALTDLDEIWYADAKCYADNGEQWIGQSRNRK